MIKNPLNRFIHKPISHDRSGSEQNLDIFEQYRELYPQSRALHERSLENMPGGVSHNLRLINPHPFYPKCAKGSKITTVEGREIIDLWMGHYAMILGHAPDGTMVAAAKALEGGWHWGIPCEDQVLLAEELKKAVPALDKMRFCCTGTEATMYAVRLARAFTRRPWVLKAEGGWHGASTDLSFSVKPPFEGAEGAGLLEPEAQGVGRIQFNDVEESLKVIEEHAKNLAAIIVEPMIGAGGFLPPRPGYLEFLREACDKTGAVLIFDEIITGFRFRYGSLADMYGVRPDLTTFGKIVGGGFPLGVYGGKEEIMALADPRKKGAPGTPVLVGGGTFSCNPVTMAGGLANLRLLKEKASGLYPALEKKGESLRKGVVERLAASGIRTKTTGMGSLFMTHILKGDDDVIESPAHVAAKTRGELPDREMKAALLNHGVYAVHGGGSVSEAHDGGDIDRVLDAYEKAGRDLVKHI